MDIVHFAPAHQNNTSMENYTLTTIIQRDASVGSYVFPVIMRLGCSVIMKPGCYVL